MKETGGKCANDPRNTRGAYQKFARVHWNCASKLKHFRDKEDKSSFGRLARPFPLLIYLCVMPFSFILAPTKGISFSQSNNDGSLFN